MKLKAHQFNLIELENKALGAYQVWTTDTTSPAYRTDLFKGVEELAYAILSVGKYDKYKIDFGKCAYEYSLYLFERLISNSFRMEPRIPGTKFPLQQYMRLNIKHVVFTMRQETAWQDLLTDLEFLLDDVQKPGDFEYLEIADPNAQPLESLVDKNRYADQLLDALQIFYPLSEIKRLMVLSLDLIYIDSRALIGDHVPKDLQDFSIVLVGLAKRLCKEHNLIHGTMDISKHELKKIFASSVRSTVFLSSIVNTHFFPKELLLALDIDSLYRLVHLLGGKTIQIPRIKELDTLLGSVVAVSKVIMEGKSVETAIKDSKQEFGFVFAPKLEVQQFVSRCLSSYNIFNHNAKVEPLLNILAMSIRSMDHLFKQLTEKSEDLDSSSLLRSYADLSSSFSKFTDSLIHISERIQDGPKNQAKA